jgi:hypothetical protein
MPGVNCLLLQAGGNGGDMTTVVPAGLTRLFQHPTLDWNLFSTKQQQLTHREVCAGWCCSQTVAGCRHQQHFLAGIVPTP